MKRTILVVEDDARRRKAIVDALAGAGYDVIAGEDFGAALQMVDRLGVDVMISDLQLSTATAHGRELARLAQRKRAPLKILFVSRAPLPGGRRVLTIPGAGDILPMPLDRTQLLDKVRALLATDEKQTAA
jgi:two-component system response regulator FlrC